MSEYCLGAKFEILLDDKTHLSRHNAHRYGGGNLPEKSKSQRQGSGEGLADWPRDRVADDGISARIAVLRAQRAATDEGHMWKRRFPYEQYNKWSRDPAEKRRWTEALEKWVLSALSPNYPTAPSVHPPE